PFPFLRAPHDANGYPSPTRRKCRAWSRRSKKPGARNPTSCCSEPRLRRVSWFGADFLAAVEYGHAVAGAGHSGGEDARQRRPEERGHVAASDATDRVDAETRDDGRGEIQRHSREIELGRQ